MNHIFSIVLKLSITAIIPMAAVMGMRIICKRSIPRWAMCFLWVLVGIKLIIPFSFQTEISLVPHISNVELYGEQIQKDIQEEIYSDSEHNTNSDILHNDTVAGTEENSEKSENSEADATDAENNTEENKVSVGLIALIWASVSALFVLYGMVSYFATKLRVSLFSLGEDGVRRCERISSPFVLGVIKPRIYVPTGLDVEVEKQIIAHEKAHVKRLDHISKILAYFVLALHWFNPLVWVAYLLFCRDIEYACDEKVLRKLDDSGKKEYATALLQCSVYKRATASAFSVPFGEIGVKKRIKSVFRIKKTGKLAFTLSLFMLVVFLTFFMTVQPEIATSNIPHIITGSVELNEVDKNYVHESDDKETLDATVKEPIMYDDSSEEVFENVNTTKKNPNEDALSIEVNTENSSEAPTDDSNVDYSSEAPEEDNNVDYSSDPNNEEEKTENNSSSSYYSNSKPNIPTVKEWYYDPFTGRRWYEEVPITSYGKYNIYGSSYNPFGYSYKNQGYTNPYSRNTPQTIHWAR